MNVRYPISELDGLVDYVSSSHRNVGVIHPPEMVTLPSHYARHHIEPIRFVVENFGPGFLIGNIVKYILRYDAKDGHKDLAKAARYVEMLRHFEAGDPDWYQPPHDFTLPAEVDAPLHSKAMKVSRG